MNGSRQPRVDVLARILQAGGSLNWLVGGIGDVDLVELLVSPSEGRLPINAKTLEHDREELEKIPIVREASEALKRKKSEQERTGIDPIKDFESGQKRAKKTSPKRGTRMGD